MHKTRTDRKKEATHRQIARNLRTATEQLMLIARRPGRALKETARLMAEREASV